MKLVDLVTFALRIRRAGGLERVARTVADLCFASIRYAAERQSIGCQCDVAACRLARSAHALHDLAVQCLPPGVIPATVHAEVN